MDSNRIADEFYESLLNTLLDTFEIKGKIQKDNENQMLSKEIASQVSTISKEVELLMDSVKTIGTTEQEIIFKIQSYSVHAENTLKAFKPLLPSERMSENHEFEISLN